MLKKRSRQVSSNQALMADPFSLPSPTSNYNKPPNSPLFPLSPRLLVGLSPKIHSELDSPTNAMSPTSILEAKPFSSVANPFFSEKNPRKPFKDQTHQPVGLGIVDELKKPSSKPEGNNRMVLFGSQLKIQIPSVPPNGVVEFGIKNRDSQLAMLSPALRSPMGTVGLVSGCLSPRDMEMSEDYTCVIAHGPNPKTTHIFDNCVVENCGDGFAPASVALRREESTRRVSDDFLTFCHACKKELGQGKDIFMYRGEKAFCSHECRYQEMLFDEESEDYSPNPASIF